MPSAKPLYSTQVRSVFTFLHDDCMSRPLRWHTSARNDRWTPADAVAVWSRLWTSAEPSLVVFRYEEHGGRGELVASEVREPGADFVPAYGERDSSVAVGGTLCRLLLMTAAGFHARNPASNMLESTRVAFDAVDGTFMPTPTSKFDVEAPKTAVLDISEMMPSSGYCGPDSRVAFHLHGIQGATSAASTPLDSVTIETVRQNLGDLYELLKLRELRIVTMRRGASDEEVQAALLELGAIRAPVPAPLEPPRRTRRGRATA